MKGFMITTISVLASFLALSSAQICPPAEVLFPCNCSEFEIIQCLNIDESVNLREIFKNASTHLDDNFIFSNLDLSSAPGHSLRLEEGTLEHLKFNVVGISGSHIEHLSPRAFNSSGNSTTYGIQIADSVFEDEENVFEFIRSIPDLPNLSFVRNRMTSIPTNAFKDTILVYVTIQDSTSLSRIESRAFSGMSRLRIMSLTNNSIPSGGLPEDAFEDIGPDVIMDLTENGMDHLEQRSYQRLLDQVREVQVGREDNVPSFYCDERADWICDNELSYRVKLVGFLCMEEEYADVWEYCAAGRNSTYLAK